MHVPACRKGKVMLAAFIGLPGVFEILIIVTMCGAPIIVALILLLVFKPWQNKADARPCPGCGQPVSALAKACPNCGKPLQK